MERNNDIKISFKKNKSYTKVGKIFGLTKQRIYQIVNNYKNTGRKGRAIFYKNATNCFMCGEKGNSLHHLDGNNSNDSKNNLLFLCNVCHGEAHTIFKGETIGNRCKLCGVNFTNKIKRHGLTCQKCSSKWYNFRHNKKYPDYRYDVWTDEAKVA